MKILTRIQFAALLLVMLDLMCAYGKSSDRKDKKNDKHAKRARDCTPQLPYVDCVISPCKAEKILGTTCERHPEAKCVNTFCGGCVAKHMMHDEEVHCGEETNVICELQNTSLSCPANTVMKIYHANYGRTDLHTCRHSYNIDDMHNNVKCYSQNATRIVSDLCEGKTVCWPEVNSVVFGDSCYGIYKYLKVDYDCIPIEQYIKRFETRLAAAEEASKTLRQISSNLPSSDAPKQHRVPLELLSFVLIIACSLCFIC